MPLRIMGDILAIGRGEEARFKRFATAQMDFRVPMFTDEEFARHLAIVEDGVTLFRELIDARRRDLGDDLLSDMIRAEESGERLTLDEMLALVAMLLTAGSETTTHFIGFGVRSILSHPIVLQAIRADWSLLDKALEEVLRHNSMGKNAMIRFALEDMEIRGTPIKKGDCLFLCMPAALRDPEVFESPDTFDIHRDQSKNITWGLGPHYCLGAALVKEEGIIAIRTLLERFPHLSLAGEATFEPHMVVRKMGSLPVRLRP
jgi:cytochrome P450 enzyme